MPYSGYINGSAVQSILIACLTAINRGFLGIQKYYIAFIKNYRKNYLENYDEAFNTV